LLVQGLCPLLSPILTSLTPLLPGDIASVLQPVGVEPLTPKTEVELVGASA
jgi:hypothetical protein